MRPCPAEETILAFVEDRLRPAQRSSTEAHVARCPSCSALVAAVASAWHAEGRLRAVDAPEARPLAAGDAIGPYTIVSLAGRGAMGEVYRARDARLGRDVALKVLPARFAGDAQRLGRFRQEARAAGALSHPNLLTVFDVGTHEGVPYLVTAWLDGTTLRERLLAGPLPPAEVARVGAALARGLAAAHDRGIVHRDVKPANVFLCADGSCRVLDFGLARLTEPAEGAEVASDTGAVVGTAGYMAPEQIRGDAIDARADLFALGAVLWEAASGRAPFGAGNAVERMSAALRDDPPPLEGELGRVVARCLAKRPGDRFQSAHDLAFALDAVAERLAAAAPRVAEPVRPAPARARRVPGWAVAAAAALACAGAAFTLGRAQPRPAAPAAAPAQPAYRPITFRRGRVFGARFTADAATLVYGAAWDGGRAELYTTRADRPVSRPLGLAADALAASADGELAILLEPRTFDPDYVTGTLARVPLAGGAPRPMLDHVVTADWGPRAETLAVVRLVGSRFRLEQPPGTLRFESEGWISEARVSPDGARVAFVFHPNPKDDRGAVMLLDGAGPPRVLSDGWGSLRGLAWAPGGSEVWFTGSRTDADYALFAVDLAGATRLVDRVAGRLVLHDVAANGTALVDHPSVRTGLAFVRDGVERDLTWSEASFATDLSADGRTVVFTEAGRDEGPSYGAYLRTTDGAPPVRLGDGLPMALSPDGTQVLGMRYGPDAEFFLWPTGPGAPRRVSLAPVETLLCARWFPDGKRLLLRASAAGRPARLWLFAPGTAPRPITPEGEGFAFAIAPDGRRIAVVDGAGALRLLGPDGAPLGAAPGRFPGATVLGWDASGGAVFLRAASLPERITRVDVRTGATAPHALVPARADRPGLVRLTSLLLSADGRAWAYSYEEALSRLYLVDGLPRAR